MGAGKGTAQAAMYGRFSTDRQQDRSISDQFLALRRLSTGEKLKVIAEYSDRGKSSATLFDRDDLLRLMRDAKERRFQFLLVESLDRLSRDAEDLAGIFKRLSFYGVQILTLDKRGPITAVDIGIRSLTGPMFLSDLKAKVRRNVVGRATDGLIPGGNCYGYRVVLGKPGVREIDADEAKVLRRIFREYVAGASSRTIAARLNADGIPGPRGHRWTFAAIQNGNGKTATAIGIVGNPLYKGQIVWNRFHTVLNPDNGRPVKRPNPESEWVTKEVPHLRIIDAALWAKAQAVRERRALLPGWPKGRKRVPVIERKQHLLSGLLRCGVCNGPMINTSFQAPYGARVSCAAAFRRNECSHTKSYRLSRIQDLVIDGFRANLVDPKMVVEAARTYHANRAERDRRAAGEAAGSRSKLNRVQVQIDRIVSAIADTDQPIKELTDRLAKLEAERVALAEKVRLLEAETNVVRLHPKALDAYRVNIERLHDRLSHDALAPETIAAFQMVVDCIVVHETKDRASYEISPYGRLSAMLGADLFPAGRSPAEILESEGVAASAIVSRSRSETRHYRTSGKAANSNDIVPLGRWRSVG